MINKKCNLSKNEAIEQADNLYNRMYDEKLFKQINTLKELKNLCKKNCYDEIWIIYARALYNVSVHIDMPGKLKIINTFEEITKTIKIKEVWIEYSSVLFNVSCECNKSARIECVNKLKIIAEKENVKKIWIKYSKVLFNL